MSCARGNDPDCQPSCLPLGRPWSLTHAAASDPASLPCLTTVAPCRAQLHSISHRGLRACPSDSPELRHRFHGVKGACVCLRVPSMGWGRLSKVGNGSAAVPCRCHPQFAVCCPLKSRQQHHLMFLCSCRAWRQCCFWPCPQSTACWCCVAWRPARQWQVSGGPLPHT